MHGVCNIYKFKIVKRMKAIISQPMKGKTEAQIRAEREGAIAHLNGLGHEVVDTIFPDFKNQGNIPLKYLAKSIEAIADVDLVYFMNGWKDARGCRIEFECCIQYGVKFILE
jgi:Asp-tRNA(Asn)/Glu-tRNA(Gln) amidotransferase A subunit family amidase